MKIDELNKLFDSPARRTSVRDKPREHIEESSEPTTGSEASSRFTEDLPAIGESDAETKRDSLAQMIAAGQRQMVIVDGLRSGGVQLMAAPETPHEAVEWMNAKHFVVSEAGKTLVFTEEHEPAL